MADLTHFFWYHGDLDDEYNRRVYANLLERGWEPSGEGRLSKQFPAFSDQAEAEVLKARMESVRP